MSSPQQRIDALDVDFDAGLAAFIGLQQPDISNGVIAAALAIDAQIDETLSLDQVPEVNSHLSGYLVRVAQEVYNGRRPRPGAFDAAIRRLQEGTKLEIALLKDSLGSMTEGVEGDTEHHNRYTMVGPRDSYYGYLVHTPSRIDYLSSKAYITGQVRSAPGNRERSLYVRFTEENNGRFDEERRQGPRQNLRWQVEVALPFDLNGNPQFVINLTPPVVPQSTEPK